MSLWEGLEEQSLFACMFERTGVVVHMLAQSLVHFTCILRRQPCTEITSASVVILCCNKGPAAGELLQLLACLPSDQTESFLPRPHTSGLFLVSFSPALLLLDLGEKRVMQMMDPWWGDTRF